MKKILTVIGVSLLSTLLFGLSNKTFFSKYYLLENKKIPIPYLSYIYEETSESTKFISLDGYNNAKKIINNYKKSMDKCYKGKIFYDSKKDISFYDYRITKEGVYNDISINYQKGNLCKDEYILEKNYLDNIDIDITKYNQRSIESLFNKIKKLDRVSSDTINNFDYDSEMIIKLSYKKDDVNNNMTIFTIDKYLIVEVVNNSWIKKYAIYKIKDAKSFIKTNGDILLIDNVK